MSNRTLTLSQQFELKRMTDALEKMSKEQVLEILPQARKLQKVKQNAIKTIKSEGKWDFSNILDLSLETQFSLSRLNTEYQNKSLTYLKNELEGVIRDLAYLDSEIKSNMKEGLGNANV